VHGGFVEVRDNRVIVLSDVAELAKDIDTARAQRAKDAATGDDEEAVAARARAEARLNAANRAS
jgi:F-type H+-transporting ATPase subunit epsilon